MSAYAPGGGVVRGGFTRGGRVAKMEQKEGVRSVNIELPPQAAAALELLSARLNLSVF